MNLRINKIYAKRNLSNFIPSNRYHDVSLYFPSLMTSESKSNLSFLFRIQTINSVIPRKKRLNLLNTQILVCRLQLNLYEGLNFWMIFYSDLVRNGNWNQTCFTRKICLFYGYLWLFDRTRALYDILCTVLDFHFQFFHMNFLLSRLLSIERGINYFDVNIGFRL